MAPEPISAAYFINLSHQFLRLYVYHPIVARQRLGKNVTAATNTHAKTKELFDPSLVCDPCRIKGKLSDSSSQNFSFKLSVIFSYLMNKCEECMQGFGGKARRKETNR
jgi:hypothetical protein